MTYYRYSLFSRQAEVDAGAICAECGVFFVEACGHEAVCKQCAKWRKQREKPAKPISPHNEIEGSSKRGVKWIKNKFKGDI